MFAAALAAVAPPLRFDDAVVEGPLPRATGDACVRLLSQTLSPAAAAEHQAATARWRAVAKAPALQLLSELPEGAAADEAAVFASAWTFLGLSTGKARARNHPSFGDRR